MSFRDMVNAAADAERLRRQRAREEAVEASRQRKAQRPEELPEQNAVKASEAIAVITTAPAKATSSGDSESRSHARLLDRSPSITKNINNDTPPATRTPIAAIKKETPQQVESSPTITETMENQQEDRADDLCNALDAANLRLAAYNHAFRAANQHQTAVQTYPAQRIAELATGRGELGGMRPQAQVGSQTFEESIGLTMAGYNGKKRKEPSQESSPGLFVEDPTPPSHLAKKARVSSSPSTPVATVEPGSAKDSAANTPIDDPATDDKEPTTKRFGPQPKTPRKKGKSVYRSKEVLNTRKNFSDWYRDIKMTDKFSRGDKATLDSFMVIVKKCVEAKKDSGDLEQLLSALRTKIHEMEHYKFLTPMLIKKSKVLEEQGLMMIFDGDEKDIFPWDIAADAEALWSRWMRGDLEGFILRGITATKTVTENHRTNTSYKMEEGYAYKRSANVVGSNNLINGQWWPSRICAFRDGAHGALEAGISGMADRGAFSIVISHGSYADEDHGDVVQYCGTECKKSSDKPTTTADTKLLEKSYASRQPVRILRAAKKGSKYAPKEGVRYDGMYDIVDKEILDPKTAMIRFSLRRVPGQDPIRYQGVEVRPTTQELTERMNIRKDL